MQSLKIRLRFQAVLLLLNICTVITVNAEPVELEMTQAASGNLYVHATLTNESANTETDLLLDTGAGYVSLSRATFNRLKGNSEPRFSRYIFGAMANGKIEKISLYFLSELGLAENCVLRNIEVALLPGADKDILGLNALSRLQPFTMQFTPATLTSAHCTS